MACLTRNLSPEVDPFQIQTGTTMTGDPRGVWDSYSTLADAAIAYAEAEEPGIENPQVTRIIGIYADEAVVDLRIQVQAELLPLVRSDWPSRTR